MRYVQYAISVGVFSSTEGSIGRVKTNRRVIGIRRIISVGIPGMTRVRRALLVCLVGGLLLGWLSLPVFALDPQSMPRQAATRTPTPKFPFYLPRIFNHYPPYPLIPRLFAIDGPEDGAFRLSWIESPVRFADTYVIQEAEDENFTQNVRTACVTAQSACDLIGMKPGRYYYRVMGINDWGSSAWSNTQAAEVLLPETPVLYRVTDQAGDSSFTVRWSAAARADLYMLQSSPDGSFTRPVTIQTSATEWRVTGIQAGVVYFRVRAFGSTGVSGWSELLAVNLLLPDIPSMGAITPSGVDGFYAVNWSPGARASSYLLEESTDRAFNLAETVYAGPAQSWKALNKDYGTYYYRVKAVNTLGESAWSGPRSITVLKPQNGVWIQGNSYTYTRDGTRHVVGEVYNNTGDTIRFMRLDVTFYDASGREIATDYAYTYLNTIFPRERACFHLAIDEPAGWRTYLISGSYSLDTVFDPGLDTAGLEGAIDISGAYRVSGSIRNFSSTAVYSTVPIATLYNPDGFVIGCSYAYAIPADLGPYQASRFSIYADPPDVYAVALFTVKVDFRLEKP